MTGRIKQPKDRSVTVRFNSEVMASIDSLADEYGVNRSDIIRLATDNSLSRYLDHVKYVDPEQGRRINQDIIRLGNVMTEICYNLKRIGGNFNQLVHKVNEGQINNLQNNGDLIRREDLDLMITRMEKITNRIGEDIHVLTD